jgi:hypothetical protein
MNVLAVAALVAAVSGPQEQAASKVPVDEDRNRGLTYLAGGAGVGVVSAVGFKQGLDAERALRAGAHDEKSADDLLNRRTIAGWVAWPTLVVGAAGVATGVTLLVLHGGEPQLPSTSATSGSAKPPPSTAVEDHGEAP